MEIIASTSQGTEDLLIQELKRMNYSAHYLKPSKVILEGKLEDVVRISFYSRQVHRVGILLAQGRATNLNDIISIVKEIDLDWLPKGSFGVRGVRIGDHSFSSLDVARVVGETLWSYFKKVNLDNPDWEFFAELSGEDFILYLNMVGPSLHKRYKRNYNHVAPLKPTIAASLIYASSFLDKREMLDPMAGSGTIALEACYMLKDVPPGLFIEEFAYERFDYLKELKQELIENVDIQECRGYVAAGDISPKHVSGIKKNLHQLIPCDCVEVFLKDAGKLDYPYVPEVVIANPPYGLRMGSKNKIHKLYERFASALSQNDVPEVVVFTAEDTKMRKELQKNGYEIEMYKRVLYGRLNTYLIKGKKLG